MDFLSWFTFGADFKFNGFKFNGFPFLVHIWGKKFWKIDKVGGLGIRVGGWKKSQKLIIVDGTTIR